MTFEQLTAICKIVFGEADEDGGGNIDMEEARGFCEVLMVQRYPRQDFDDDAFKTGFNRIDDDKSGHIEFKELVLVIAANLKRQGMLKE